MKRAFTLIELLIVVAIIAILAAIAVPNFLEAQTRAKVSRCKSDLRSLATALESYCADNSRYPFDRLPYGFPWYPTDIISTPIPYITAVPNDLFTKGSGVERLYGTEAFGFLGKKFRYLNIAGNRAGAGWACCYIPAGKAYSGKTVSGWAEVSDADARKFEDKFGAWKMQSMGPDKIVNDVNNSFVTGEDSSGNPIGYYDPTNGTISRGDIQYSSKGMKN